MFINNCSVQYDYIFAGPPYPLPDLGSIPDYIFNAAILKETGLFVLEHNPQYKFNEHPHFMEERKYGQTRFSFFHFKS
jgi:16S rRNA (guanine966-N2)-methyltransferase